MPRRLEEIIGRTRRRPALPWRPGIRTVCLALDMGTTLPTFIMP
jgi:hypothetical protein